MGGETAVVVYKSCVLKHNSRVRGYKIKITLKWLYTSFSDLFHQLKYESDRNVTFVSLSAFLARIKRHESIVKIMMDDSGMIETEWLGSVTILSRQFGSFCEKSLENLSSCL